MSNSKKKGAPSAALQNEDAFNLQQQKQCSNNLNPTPKYLDWTSSYQLSDTEAEEISDPEWIIENLVIRGHVVLLPAEPNGGKTTIMFHLAGEMAQKGYEVCYVNVDISGGDVKPMLRQSKDNGFSLMLPDFKQGLSIDDILNNLVEMSESNDRFDNVVFLFDTLKKLFDVINKRHAKTFFMLCRTLSAKGMTLILLAHTNKYKDKEDKPIYEGTGDMRSDVDELIYFIPDKHEDGSMTVTTLPDKVRGAFKPITFDIDQERKVKKVLAKYTLDKTILQPSDKSTDNGVAPIWQKVSGDKNGYIFSKIEISSDEPKENSNE